MNNRELLGKRIKEIRKQSGYTQEKLVGIDVTTLSGIESRRHFPSLVTLEKIANILKVPLVAFFDFSHLVSLENMKTTIKNNLNTLNEEDIKFIYKFISKKCIDDKF